ncbi:Haem peroxidase,Haem peroxidase, animal type [Cinara cedri]|uniref:Haem peroxidase,Haem peroxidase, animal type n=1 Tax=Cinara cedri TaxID=506608 RepID=A0A5E4M8E2_9HEMI|nr:Haem peroxidase,Haem peroxidase, animal type [Cinara cedri]
MILNLCVWLLCIVLLLRIQLSNQSLNPVLYYGNGPPSNDIYYLNCAPQVICNPNEVYRTVNGSCNNLEHTAWGASTTPFIRLLEAAYADGAYEFRRQLDGTKLPGPRELQLALFLYRSRDTPDIYNIHVSQFGQWITHDMSLLLPDISGPKSCCDISNDGNTPFQCQALISIPIDDPVYSESSTTCMEFRRAKTATRYFNCTITPQIPMNLATSFIDSSQLYGPEPDKAAELRTFENGRLKTERINEHDYCPLQNRNKWPSCDARDIWDICFDAGDPRMNQNTGLIIYQTSFTRFHNYLTQKLQRLNPEWEDEVLYQEARRIVVAINQILVYQEYLPIILGKKYTERFGLSLNEFKPTQYDSSIMPQVTIEFSAGAFRVPHNTFASKYNLVDENYKTTSSIKLHEWISNPDILVERSNFDDILRGMAQTPGRAPSPSYNFPISNFMRFLIPGNQDLLSWDIQRGRDCGVPSYNHIRELCGFKRARSFDDLADSIYINDLMKLKKLYASVDDVDLIVGALLEPPCFGAQVGPTARCIITDVFYRIRYADRFFFDVENQPGSFSNEQLKALRNIDLGHVFCAGSEIYEVPKKIFKLSSNRRSNMRNCEEHLLKLDLSAWKTNFSYFNGN